jgi:hypothetical protein
MSPRRGCAKKGANTREAGDETQWGDAKMGSSEEQEFGRGVG